MIIKTPRSRVFALIDLALTAAAWIFFLHLFNSGITSILKDNAPSLAIPQASRFLPLMYTLLAYVAIALCIGLVLSLWAKYNEIRFGRFERRTALEPISDEKLASGFGVPESQLADLHENKRLVIHHTPEGYIRDIKVRNVEVSRVMPLRRVHSNDQSATPANDTRVAHIEAENRSLVRVPSAADVISVTSQS